LLQSIQSYCNQIVFTGTDVHTTLGFNYVHLKPDNLNKQIQDGVDINISDRLPIEAIDLPGRLDFSVLASYINQQRTIQVNTNGSVSNVNFADTFTAPRWGANATLTYNIDRLTTAFQLRYYSPIKYDANLVGPDEPKYNPASSSSINRNVWPAAYTFNLNVSYDVIKEDNGRRLQAYFNVDNLFDRNPPLIWAFVSNYDVVGRYFKVGLRYSMP
jgi:hypothetical protein